MSDNAKQNLETFEFQAEIKQLLDILAHSLYKNKEIFIRELVSNASDALSKMRIELLTNNNVLEPDVELSITIEANEEDKTLIITDTGIGMTKNELIENIGTIARSGTGEFFKRMAENKNKDIDLIGQFGVGFYSVFTVAEKIRIISKSYKLNEPAYEWLSDGSNNYSISESDKQNRGTRIEIFLKEEEKEYLNLDRIKTIIKKYSNFISYPINVKDERVNQVSAIWTRSKHEITDQDYIDFYRFITYNNDEPLFHIHFSADAPIQFYTILYVPTTNYDMFKMSNPDYGLSLYSNKVLIDNLCKDLLPEYLRFIRGIVDSEDVPLNVSRETIQTNRTILTIRTNLISKVLNHLEEMAKLDEGKYLAFWTEYGRFIKEGILKDYANQAKIATLLRYNTSIAKDEKKPISLDTIVERMKSDQKEIYYVFGTDIESIEKSPHIEIFKQHEIEILYLTDPIDDIVMGTLNTYKDKPIKSVDKAELDFIKNAPPKIINTEEEPEEYLNNFNKYLSYLKSILDNKVTDVVESKRLTESPCCLVNPDQNMSTQMQMLLKSMNKGYEMMKKIFEVNRKHQMVKNLVELYTRQEDSDLLKDASIQLYDNAVLLEGIPEDITKTVDRMNNILSSAIEMKLKNTSRIIS